jgi:hypothetical protein
MGYGMQLNIRFADNGYQQATVYFGASGLANWSEGIIPGIIIGDSTAGRCGL